MEEFLDLKFTFSVKLHSQEHADNVEEEIMDKLHSMRQNGGRIQELELVFWATNLELADEQFCIGTGWIAQVSDTLASITLSLNGSCYWDDDLWQNIDLCKNLTRINVLGDYAEAYLGRLRLPLLLECRLDSIDRHSAEHIVKEHTQLENLHLCGEIYHGLKPELKIDSCSLEHLKIDCYDGRLILNTPNLLVLELLFFTDDVEGDQLVVLDAPRLQVLRINEHEDWNDDHYNITRLRSLACALAAGRCPVRKFEFLCQSQFGCGLMNTLSAILPLLPQLEEVVLLEHVTTERDASVDWILHCAQSIPSYQFQRKVKVSLLPVEEHPAVRVALKTLAGIFVNWTWDFWRVS